MTASWLGELTLAVHRERLPSETNGTSPELKKEERVCPVKRLAPLSLGLHPNVPIDQIGAFACDHTRLNRKNGSETELFSCLIRRWSAIQGRNCGADRAHPFAPECVTPPSPGRRPTSRAG